MFVDKIEKYLPQRGFFRLYHEFTRWGEVCPRYNFFVATTLLGSVLQRRVFLQRGTKTTFPTLYPNPWVVLVGPQGVGKKGTALRTGTEIINMLPENLRPRILASKLTPEALIKALASQEITPGITQGLSPDQVKNILRKQATGLISSTELGVLLGREKYNVGLINLLTDLYDCHDEWHSETVMRGDQRLYDIALVIKGASTPTWMQSMLPIDAFKTGFMSRLFIVPLPRSWRKRVTDPPPPPPELLEKILKEIELIAESRGRIELSPQAFELFDAWYMSLDSSLLPEAVVAYTERKQDHLLRFAMLIQLAYTPGKLILEKTTLQDTLNILDSIEEEVNDLVEYIATEPRMRSVQKMLEVVRAHGRISEPKLVKQVWRTLARTTEWWDAVQILVKAKEIEGPFVEGNRIYYKYIGKEEKK